ncbi:MAG TPA: IS4 family transposase [Chloroflexota bacterium]|nr:IS4 family transposase [Chloroflexota bacterium]
MTTIPQVAAAMQEILTATADAAGRTTGFVQRVSPLSGATFTQTLVFGWLANPAAALEELTQTAATLGVAVSPQALDQRFTSSAAACLERVLSMAITRVVAAAPVAIPILDRFTAVYLQDSSTIVLPDVLAEVWQGCGGSTSQHTAAALKLQVRLELRTGHLAGPQLQDGRASDHDAALPTILPAGALWLADLGYWRLDELERLDDHQVFWLSHLQTTTAVHDAAGQRHDVLALLEAQYSTLVDVPIRLGVTHQLPARLLAVKVPQEVADQRRRKLKAEARRKGKMVSATRLVLAGWTILVTNVPPERLAVHEALVLARTRWQIELLFKLWKSHGRIDESRSAKPWRVLCEVYAKLLAMVVQHWLFLVSCWRYPDRSLTKAAQTVRKHALHLASAFGDTEATSRAMATMQRCLAAGCRMNRRKKAPNTYQLLLDLTSEPMLA